MKLFKSILLSLTGAVILAAGLIVQMPAADSSSLQENPTFDRAETSNEVRLAIPAGLVLVVQMRGGKVEMIPAARVITYNSIGIDNVEDENGNIIRVSENLGSGSDLIASGTMTEIEARQLLESGGVLVQLN